MGRFAVARDGAEIPAVNFGGRKVRTLLRVLATRRGGFVPTDVLVELLWPDRPPADPAANLQVLVNRARRATGAPSLILTGPGGYALTQDRFCVVDAEEFLAAEHECSAMTGRPALTASVGALALYHGEPLPEDRYAAWAEQYAASILRVRQRILERAAEIAIECGDVGVAVEWATQAVAAEPLREVAALTLTRALAAAGDQAGAVRHYDTYRRILADELGLDPSPEAAALHIALLDGSYRSPPPIAVNRVNERVGALRFVGRDTEVAQLLAALPSRATGTADGIAVLAGGSGSGKSRLLARLATAIPAVSVRAYWPHRSEPWTLARAVLQEIFEADIGAADGLPDALRAALASIAPDIVGRVGRPTESGVADPESRRALAIEAGVRLVSAMANLVLVVDDLQWADPSSVQLLAAIADRAPQALLVLAYRPEEIAPDGETATFLQHANRAVTVELAGLAPSGIDELVLDGRLARALTESTDRTPLAVSEVLTALARDGLVSCDNNGCWRVTSDRASSRAAELGALGQRTALRRRAHRQTGLPLLALKLLALSGRQLPARTLADAADVGESIAVEALSVLSAAGLARLGEQGWATAHDMVADVVTDRLDVTDRRRLHGVLAAALETGGAEPAEVARHWSESGDTSRAAEAYGRAAAAALAACADAEAEQLADDGLRRPSASDTEASLHHLRAQARRRRGDISGARADLHAALSTNAIGPQRAMVLAELATLASGADDLIRASELVELAIVESGDDAAVRAHTLEVASVIDMNLARPSRARRRAGDALAIFQRIGDSQGAARILDARAMAVFLQGDIRRGTELLNRAANLFEDCGDLMRVVTPRSTRGHGLVFLDQPVQGLADASAALEIARRLGHPEGQCYALWHRSEALSAIGRAAEADADGRQSLSIASRIGHRGWTATAWRAIGIAQQVSQEPDAALEAFRTSLESSDHLDLFGSWAAARLALVLVLLGRCDEADPLIDRAFSQGPPLAHYEARLARVEAAAARSDPAAAGLASAALIAAEKGGMLAHRPRLLELSDQ